MDERTPAPPDASITSDQETEYASLDNVTPETRASTCKDPTPRTSDRTEPNETGRPVNSNKSLSGHQSEKTAQTVAQATRDDNTSIDVRPSCPFPHTSTSTEVAVTFSPVIYIQLAAANVINHEDVDVDSDLLINVRGLPCQLKDIPTFNHMLEYLKIFLHDTLSVHGISTRYIIGFYFVGSNENGQPAMRRLISVKVFEDPSLWLHYMQEIASFSSGPFVPILYVVFNKDHLTAALSSRGIEFRTGFSMLDINNQQFLHKFDDPFTSAAMKAAMFHTLCGSRQHLPVLNVKPPIHLPIMLEGQQVGAVLINHNSKLGNLCGLFAGQQPSKMLLEASCINSAGSYVVKGSVDNRHGSASIQLEPIQYERAQSADARRAVLTVNPNAIFLSQPSDSERENVEVQTRKKKKDKKDEEKGRRRKDVEQPKKRVRKPSIIVPDKWSKAAEQPSGNTKDQGDTCLTCIKFARICKGTTITNGKCDNCVGGKGKGHGGRKCYWKDPARGVYTYEDAREADPSGRSLPQNTRPAVAARPHKRGVATTPRKRRHVSEDSDSDIVEASSTIYTSPLRDTDDDDTEDEDMEMAQLN